MKPIIVLSEPGAPVTAALRGLSALYVVMHLHLEETYEEQARDAAMIIVDMTRIGGEHTARLKRLLAEKPDVPQAALITASRRQEIVQAQALGLKDMWDREAPAPFVIAKVRALLGSYAKPDLGSDVPVTTRKAVESACMAYESLLLANAISEPFPMKVASSAVFGLAEALRLEGLGVWLSAVQSHHSSTFAHCMMVSGLAIEFADLLGMSAEEKNLVGLGALFHDLGKVKLPLSILDKPGSLNAEERNLISLHPEYSREILDQHPEVPTIVRDMALDHHEKLDGSGYPRGLKGAEISRYVRLLAICDIYAALTETRSYRDGLSPRQAFAVLTDMEGALDPELLSRFKEVVLKPDALAPRKMAAAKA